MFDRQNNPWVRFRSACSGGNRPPHTAQDSGDATASNSALDNTTLNFGDAFLDARILECRERAVESIYLSI
jgi:hypothetical protein